jgi:hypothetical protein
LRTPRGLTGASFYPADTDVDGQPLPTRRGSPRSDADRVPDVGVLARDHHFALALYPELVARRRADGKLANDRAARGIQGATSLCQPPHL